MDIRRRWLAATLLIICPHSHALGLFQAYELATLHDSTFQAARDAHAAGQENIAIARAELLPQVTMTYQNTPWNKQTANHEISDGYTPKTSHTYSSYASSITLTQPIFDTAAWFRWKQGGAQASMADAQFRMASQSLALRVLKAYTDALFARDQAELTQAQRDTYAEQLKRNRQAFRDGDGTRTDIAETEARLQLAEVSLIDAQDAAEVARRSLWQIVGLPGEAHELLDVLTPDFVERIAPALRTPDLGYWQDVAAKRNAELEYQRHSVDAARHEWERQRARHLPTASLYLQHSRNKSEMVSSYRQRHQADAIGITVSIPLFNGGGVSAYVRQADHQLRGTTHTLHARTNDIMLEIERQYRLSQRGSARIDASFKAVQAAKIAWEGNRHGVEVGERINLDVLNAAQQFHTARLQLMRAIYDTLNAQLTLKQAAGVLTASDLIDTSRYFIPPSDKVGNGDHFLIFEN